MISPPNGTCRRRLKTGHQSGFDIAFVRPQSHIDGVDGNAKHMTIDEIRDNFALLDDWDDRYRYVIELGRTLAPMPEPEHSAANKVQGCASQVWLSKHVEGGGQEPIVNYLGDSDAHIVRGLIAILLTLYSGRTPREILDIDAPAVFNEFGFREHLTPQRSNGLRSMVERIRTDAREALAEAS
jgi:cysteine desulfuration protein SufE